jgi:hypothetical protein
MNGLQGDSDPGRVQPSDSGDAGSTPRRRELQWLCTQVRSASEKAGALDCPEARCCLDDAQAALTRAISDEACAYGQG